MKVTYIHHSAFLVELINVCLLFDYTEGALPPIPEEKPLLVFASHRHGDHYSKEILEFKKKHFNTRYIFSHDIWRKRLPEETLLFVDSMEPGQKKFYRIEAGSVVLTEEEKRSDIETETYKSTDEGVAFLVRTEGKTIYHAGDLNNWTWEGESLSVNEAMAKKYTEQVDKLSGVHIDLAFLPLDPRQEGDFYLGFDEFMKKTATKAAFPMHCWGDFSVIDRLKRMETSAMYRDRIAGIHEDQQCFFIE